VARRVCRLRLRAARRSMRLASGEMISARKM
jgi:hypothetical protein